MNNSQQMRETITNNHEFNLSPIQHYTPPAYPTRAAKPLATLKKLPVRWAKNAAIIACIGALGLGALTGCTAQAVQPTAPYDAVACLQEDNPYAESERTFDVVIRTHHGGSGAGPFYVAHLTEQEALGIIRNRLCQAGFCFDSPVPNYVATAKTAWSTEITATLSLFNEQTRQGIVFPWSSWEEFWWDMPQGHIEHTLQQDFARRFNVFSAFMYNPSESMCNGDWWDREEEPTFTDEQKQEAGGILEERLSSQVDTVIDQLRTGVLPPVPFPFADVAEQHWARQAIEHVWEQRIMTGTNWNAFAPDITLTRAQVTAILWRMAGEPAVEFQPAFDDVPITASAWYRNAVIWANENEIVQGFSGQFDPHGEATREQFAAMLYRYAQFTGYDVSVPESFSLDNFRDRTQLSEWATYYMRWAVYQGLITGTAEDTLSPLGTATRAEAAMILMRLMKA